MATPHTEQDRYARARLLPWWNQDSLSQAVVLVAGAGATGNEVIKLLALAGVGRVIVVDFDRIEQTNLTRSVLYRDGDVGKWKATTAAKQAEEINPEISTTAIVGDLEFEIGIGIFRSVDIVIGCLDSINARLALNLLCGKAGIAWLDTGIEAEFCNIALYGADRHGEAACFQCTMTESMWERRNLRFSCTGMPSDIATEAVPTTGVMASIAAGIAVHEAILHLHRLHLNSEYTAPPAGILPGERLTFSIQPYQVHVLSQSRHIECDAHMEMSPTIFVEADPAVFTPRMLFQACKVESLHAVLELGFDLCTQMHCIRCGCVETINRPIELVPVAMSHCPQCGLETRSPEQLCTVAHADPQMDMTLQTLCIPPWQVLCIKNPGGRIYVQISGEPMVFSPTGKPLEVRKDYANQEMKGD